MLYHATRADLVSRILEEGLQPQAGAYARRYHPHPVPLVYACDDPVSPRITCALGFHSLRSLVETGVRRKNRPVLASGELLNLRAGRGWRGLRDADIATHGALVLIENTADFRHAAWGEADLPPGVEPGDHYCARPVAAAAVLRGADMMDFLHRAGLERAHLPPEWQRGGPEPEDGPEP